MTNNIHTKLLLTIALPLFAATAAQAQTGWSGEAGLSGSVTTGNTETTDIGAVLSLSKEADIWTHNFDGTIDYGEVNDAESKNRLFLGYQIDRDINERLYAFANANYFKDEFGSYETGYFLGGGLGYDVLIDEPMLWALEGGIGYRSQTLQGSGDDEGEFAIRAASDFDYAFNDAVSFYNDSEVIWSDSDTYLWNDAGINAQLAGNLSARFGVRVDHHTDVPVGVEKTDTTTRATLVYAIR